VYRRCDIIKKEGEAHLKDRKLKRTAIFIGIFAAVILGSIIFMRIFRPPPEPEPLFPTTGEITSMTEETTTEEESTTEPPEWITEPTTVSMTDTAAGVAPGRTATTVRTTARTNTAVARTTTVAPRPATTRAPTTTTRAPVTTASPPATTMRTTTRATTTKSRTTIRPPTTTRTTTTTARPPTTTSAADSLIAYGIDYGKSIGLTYRPQLTQGGEAVSGATQQAIRSKLDQAKESGTKEFNIYSVRQGSTQTIYIIWKR